MPPNLATGEEEQQKFQHRWTFRRKEDNDLDSSSNDSKSSGSSGDEPSLKQPKLASSLLPVNDHDDDGEANDVDDEVQEKGNSRRRATTTISTAKDDDVGKNKRKKRLVPAKRGNQQRKKSNNDGNAASEQVSLNELKNYMSSLLDDMKATRGNLLTWLKEELQKVVAEEVALELDRRQCNSSQLQQQNGSLEATTQSQYQNLLPSKQFQHQTDFQQQHLPSFEENNRVQNQRTFQENIQQQQQQQQNHFWPLKRDQSCEVVTPQRLAKNNRPSEGYNYSNLAAENPNDYSMAIVPVSSTEEEGREEGFGLSAKSESLQEKQPKIVLGISAHHSAGEASRRSRKGKRVAEDKQVNCSQAILPLPSSEKDKAGRVEFEPLSFSYSNPSGQATSSSMYFTLPSVMNRAHGASQNHRLDAAPTFNSNVQTRVQGSHLGYFQSLLQPEESSSIRSRSFTPLSSRDMGYFRDSYMPSPMVGSGFPVGLHQSVNGNLTIPSQLGLEGLSRPSNHGIGLRMAGGGIRLSGGSYSTVPVQHTPSNLHGRSMAFQDGFQFQK